MNPFLFFKALPKAKPPGKAAKQERPGTKPDEPLADYARLLGILRELKAGGQFGPHNVRAGDGVAFAAGEFKGAGKVVAAGQDGATVQDKAAREHRVHWHEVTAHQPGKGDDKKAGDEKK